MAQPLRAHQPWDGKNYHHGPYIIHPGWLELPLAITIFHGPKPVIAIEVLP